MCVCVCVCVCVWEGQHSDVINETYNDVGRWEDQLQ